MRVSTCIQTNMTWGKQPETRSHRPFSKCIELHPWDSGASVIWAPDQSGTENAALDSTGGT